MALLLPCPVWIRFPSKFLLADPVEWGYKSFFGLVWTTISLLLKPPRFYLYAVLVVGIISKLEIIKCLHFLVQ